MKSDYWSKDDYANLIKEEEEIEEYAEEKLFMAKNFEEEDSQIWVWFLDNGLSNHMTGFKELFTDLDETKKQT